MFKLVFWVALIGIPVFVGAQVVPVVYNNMKIENVFEGASKNLIKSSETDVKKRIYELLRAQSVDFKILPKTFSENFIVEKENGKLYISSEYHVVIWLLGKPSIDPDGDYNESDVSASDKLKVRARMDFDFAPHAETP